MDSKTDPIDALYEQLKATHRRAILIEIDGQLFGFRKPSQDEYEDWQEVAIKFAAGATEKRISTSYRELCLRTLVHGEVDRLAAVFEEYPAQPKEIGSELIELAKGALRLVVKKG